MVKIERNPAQASRLVVSSYIWIAAVPLCLVMRAAILGPDFVSVMIGIPAILFAGVIGGAVSLYAAIKFAVARYWRQSFKAVLPAFIVCGVVFTTSDFVWFCNYLGDAAHFVAMRQVYQSRVDAISKENGPRLVIFNWGGMAWASEGVVYDESDEIRKRPGTQSAGWKQRASATELSCEPYGADPLWDHYYLVSFSC